MSTVKFIPEPKILKQYSASHARNHGAGTCFKVVNHPEKDSVEEYVIRTNDDKSPFVSLNDGSLWGEYINNYIFEIVERGEIVIKF